MPFKSEIWSHEIHRKQIWLMTQQRSYRTSILNILVDTDTVDHTC